MRDRLTFRTDRHNPRAAFTLTEMLVATGLVVLIMMMFAQIFGTALGTIGEQRGMANNDQKARVVTTLLRNDLKNMTYRQPAFPYGDVQGIVALAPGDERIIDPDNQRGYFYYSENSPALNIDDVIQFTAMIEAGNRGNVHRRNQQRPYIGRAVNLVGGPNQPNRDDGNPQNNRGQSRAAEIAYFVRGGNLYRRVFLLRDPITRSQPRWESQPGLPNPQHRVPVFGPSPPSSRDYGPGFWRDFDYAATRVFDDPTVESAGLSYLWFHSIDSLGNNQGKYNHPIALPWHRFGHLNDQRDFVTNAAGMEPPDSANTPLTPWPDNIHHGSPREYAIPGDPTTFLGRFTAQETSSNNLNWPGLVDPNGQVFSTFDRSIPLPFDPDEISIAPLQDGERIAEDILLTNVEAFDVKILDPATGQFVDLGAQPGAFGPATNSNPNYGPAVPAGNNVFDTWHPDAFVLPLEQSLVDGAPANPEAWLPRRLPPRRPLLQHAGANIVTWAPGQPAQPGMILFPLQGMFSAQEALHRLPNQPSERSNQSFAYRCIRSGEMGLDGEGNPAQVVDFGQGGQPGMTGMRQPEWPLVPGQIVVENEDNPANTIVWQCFDNRIGLRAIQITIRYRDIQSNLPRQVTIVHSFVE
jgi:hypothetical protein